MSTEQRTSFEGRGEAPPRSRSGAHDWPEIPYTATRDTCATLHLFTQVVGKVRLARTPWLNHSWHATLYVTSRGLTTSPIPYGSRTFQIDFDLIDHALVIDTSTGEQRRLPLSSQSIAAFTASVFEALAELDLRVRIHGVPNEIPNPVAFHEDRAPRVYDREAAHRYWTALVQVDRVFHEFRTAFLGKSSPVHLFWGAFDLAVTRFSGRRAPLHGGGVPGLPDEITREAYSHEVSSAGFWPGGQGIEGAAFYSYAYPEPDGFGTAAVRPAQAYYDSTLKEFILPYDAVRTAADPDGALLEFLQSTYEAAADLGAWNRPELECALGEPRVPRKI